jgi:hypothetical protein
MLLLVVNWDEFWFAGMVHIIFGLVVAFIFLLVLLAFLRPSLVISDNICSVLESGKPVYRFKVINKSIYHAFDANIELFLMQPIVNNSAHTNLKYKPIKLTPERLNQFNRHRRGYSRKDPHALFATLIKTSEDLSSLLSISDTYLELQITVKHGLTGLGGSYSKKFSKTNIHKDHKFKFGDNKDITNIHEMK